MEDKEKPATHPELETALEQLLGHTKSNSKNSKLRSGFSYIGQGISYVTKGIFNVALVGSVVTYGAMSFSYGPYDTGRVLYSEISGDKSIKRKEFAEAKFLYADKFLNKSELDEKDMEGLFRSLRVIPQNRNYDKALKQVSWSTLLDFNEDNRDNWNPFN